MQDERITGAAWALVDSGEVITGSTGLHDATTGASLRSSDRVQVGSVTKTLIALAILRLVTEERVRLDAEISQLLPDLPIENPWQQTNPLRLRSLLDHTSGLEDARLWQVFSLEASPDVPLREAVLGSRRALVLRTVPGRVFSYSNTGYAILGMVIEAVTGERYETYLDRTLLAPLGMTHSTFGYVTQSVDTTLAMGHFDDGSAHASVPQFLRPATQFTTTAADMGRLAQFLMSDGRIAGEVFVDRAYFPEMGRPRTTDAATAGLHTGYSLGLARRDRNGAIGMCHGGNTVGYRAMLCLFPAQDKAFFISLNSDSETADYGRFDRHLIAALDLATFPPASRAAPERDPAEWNGWYVPSPGRFESFAYLDRLFGVSRGQWDGESFHFRPLQGTRRVLVPAGGMLFTATDRQQPSHVLLEVDGKRRISDGIANHAQIAGGEIAALWLSLVAGIIGLLGLIVVGIVRLVRRLPFGPLAYPLEALGILLIGALLIANQPFLSLGDRTLGSMVLAFGSYGMPATLLYALVARMWRGAKGKVDWIETVALAAATQWVAVLVWWGVVPIRLWV